MAKMKTEFELVNLLGAATKNKVYISLPSKSNDQTTSVRFRNDFQNRNYYLKRKDLERFAVNILKALGSKKLK